MTMYVYGLDSAPDRVDGDPKIGVGLEECVEEPEHATEYERPIHRI